jgi:hypothetical protein
MSQNDYGKRIRKIGKELKHFVAKLDKVATILENAPNLDTEDSDTRNEYEKVAQVLQILCRGCIERHLAFATVVDEWQFAHDDAIWEKHNQKPEEINND